MISSGAPYLNNIFRDPFPSKVTFTGTGVRTWTYLLNAGPRPAFSPLERGWLRPQEEPGWMTLASDNFSGLFGKPR